MSTIQVLNPTPDEARAGIVEIRVKTPVPALEKPFIIKDDRGTVLQAQYEIVDKEDRTRDTLVVCLQKAIPPGSTATLQILPASAPPDYTAGFADPRTVEETGQRGVKLVNHVLDIYLSLVPDHLAGSSFYAGAATSVNVTDERLPESVDWRRKELLDALNLEFLKHDPQKRCMQIDVLQLSHPATDPEVFQTYPVSHQRYHVIALNEGPLRASVTVASETFDYAYHDPGGGKDAKAVTIKCRLYRVLSIYRDDAILEQIYVRGVIPKAKPEKAELTADFYFSARFFAYMDFGRECAPIHYSSIPDWLALGCAWDPKPGYGFCTDVHATPVQSPHPDFQGPGADRTFSWSLGHSAGATCLHLFKLDMDPELLAHETGKAWYYRIYQPLRGRIA